METADRWKRPGYLWAATVLTLAGWMCLMSLGLASGVSSRAARAHLPPGFIVQACRQMRVGWSPQLAIWWVSPDVPQPFSFSRGAVCSLVPWLPILPRSGMVTFPP